MPGKKPPTQTAVGCKKSPPTPVEDKKTERADIDSQSDSEGTSSSSDEGEDDNDQEVQLPPPSTTTPPVIIAAGSAPVRTLKRTEVWLDIQVPPFDLGRVVIELFPDCPLAHENFRSLCTSEVTDPATKQKMSYAGTLIDQINDDYIVLGEICDDADERDGIEIIEDDFDADNDDSDDETLDGIKSVLKVQKPKKANQKATITSKDQKINIVHDTKKSAVSIYGGFFPDEPAGLQRQHIKAGTVSMFAEKTNRNGSKFLITLKPHMSWLDGQYTVIGQVTSGLRACHSLLSYKDTQETAVISNCGRMKKNSQGVDKANDFLTQAVELKQGPCFSSGNENARKQDDGEGEGKTPTLCEKCQSPAKYRGRQLGKGCKYICRSADCGHAFFVADQKYSRDIIEKAIELRKQAKQDAHTATVLMQNHKYRQRIHQQEKEQRLAKKATKEAPEILTKINKNVKKAVTTPFIVEKQHESTNIVYASPQLAVSAQIAMEGVNNYKREKQKAQVQGRKDHEKFVRDKKMERGEYDEEGNDLKPRQFKRKHDQIEYDREDTDNTMASRQDEIVDAWFGGKGKKQKGNDRNVTKSTGSGLSQSEKNQNKAMRRVYNEKSNSEHKEMHRELSAMSKDDRRQFKRSIGIQPGPSKTQQSNLNKRGADPRMIPKKPTYKSVQRGAIEKKNDTEKKKKKNKTRWRDRDAASLPTGYVIREAKNKK